MYSFLYTFWLTFCFAATPPPDGFKAEQKKFPRVAQAFSAKGDRVIKLLKDKKLSTSKLEICLRAFKQENKLEIWGRNGKQKFTLVKAYDICYASGSLGPKRKEGDKKVPEGFYKINHFNPESTYHLSLGVNYPNASDLLISDKKTPGGDIYIHGDCVSIGCLAMTDDIIDEIYVLAVEARNAGQIEIPVHIFPCRLTETKSEALFDKYPGSPYLVAFWKSLKKEYDYFEKHKQIPVIGIDDKGRYLIKAQ